MESGVFINSDGVSEPLTGRIKWQDADLVDGGLRVGVEHTLLSFELDSLSAHFSAEPNRWIFHQGNDPDDGHTVVTLWAGEPNGISGTVSSIAAQLKLFTDPFRLDPIPFNDHFPEIYEFGLFDATDKSLGRVSFKVVQVPEPGLGALVMLGFFGLSLLRRRLRWCTVVS